MVLLFFENLKNPNPSSIPKDKIIKTYALDIKNRIITEHNTLMMLPEGFLNSTYIFIIKSEHGNLFPYKITVNKNLSINVKLLAQK